MPAISSGRIVKAQRGKKPPGQQHQKNHRWESFSSKIAKLHSLDPLRRVRRHDLDEATAGDLSVTTSYFRNGLEKWADLNLSRLFTSFRRAVQPLSESLPLILHFEARIMDELARAIVEAQTLDDEREALEPLLDLLTAFAHDLGTRFAARGYGTRAFVLLVGVARHNSGAGIARSHHQQNHVLDAAVIEWTFAALAFMFKYLAKELVPDLRPTYDILAPLLGAPASSTDAALEAAVTEADKSEKKEEKEEEKEEEVEEVEKDKMEDGEENKKKESKKGGEKNSSMEAAESIKKFPSRVPGHIARFAAEAMSFLVKKAAAPSRRETALKLIIEHARDGLLRAVEEARHNSYKNNKNGSQLYAQSIMTMFAESIKGSGASLHSSGPELFVALLRAIPDSELAAGQSAGQQQQQDTTWSDVCCGVLTSIVHHASLEALQLVVDAVLAEGSSAASAASAAGDPWRLSVYVRLMGVLAGVRGGSKVEGWAAMVQLLSKVLEAMTQSQPQQQQQQQKQGAWPAEPSVVWRQLVVNVAIVWSQAPVDAVIPSVSSLTQVMGREPLSRWFIPFCAYLVELNVSRFRELLQRPFQRFVVGRWADDGNEDVLCAVLPVMVATRGAFLVPTMSAAASAGRRSTDTVNSGCLALPQSWQDQIVSRFEQLEITPFPERGAYDKDPDTWRARCLPKYAALLDVLDSTAAHPSTLARIAELLLRKLRLALRPTGTPSPQQPTNAETAFIVTQGFRSYLRMTAALAATPDAGLRPLLRAAAPRFARRPGFLEALLQYEEAVSATGSTDSGRDKEEVEEEEEEEGDEENDPFVRALVENLSSTSHRLRLVSLLILQRVLRGGEEKKKRRRENKNKKADEDEENEERHRREMTTLDSMVQIERIPTSAQSARNIAVHLRKLALAYAHVADGSWLQAALPAFLFGMLSVPLAPVWDDAVEAMKQVAQANKAGEEAVAQLAFSWLDVGTVAMGPGLGLGSGPGSGPGSGSASAPAGRLPVTDFDCFNFARLNEVAAHTEEVVTDPSVRLRQSFEEKQAAVPAFGGAERGKALKVLATMPAMAERRSRRLVPHLLSWTEERLRGLRVEDEEDEEDEEEDEKMDEEGDEEDDDKDEEMDGEENTENTEHTEHIDSLPGGWSFADKKALVAVFSQFTNGQALYQSERAHDALLKLMGNGDGDVQRLALKALLSWRQPGLLRHRESLEQLLDEAKFKNELTLLLLQQGEGETDASGSTNGSGGRRILPEDRAALMPVLLRLLYGRAIAKKGAASGRQGLHATRLFIIRSLRSLDAASLGGFLQIALGSLQRVRVLERPGVLRDGLWKRGDQDKDQDEDGDDDEALLPARKQVGVLNMLESIINELGTDARPYMDDLVNATLYCLISACRGLRGESGPEETDERGGDLPDESRDHMPPPPNTSLRRVAKTTALRCLCALFRNGSDFDWAPYRAAIVGEVVSPGIARLPQETTQGVSWTWRLLGTWAEMPRWSASFLSQDARIVPKMLESLSMDRAKDAVKIYALGIVESLVGRGEEETSDEMGDDGIGKADAAASRDSAREEIISSLIRPNLDIALDQLQHVLRRTSAATGAEISRPLLEACVDTVVLLSPLVRASAHARSLVEIATWLLSQPSRRVSPRVKGGLLRLLERFIRLEGSLEETEAAAGTEMVAESTETLSHRVFVTIASLFSFFRDRDNRLALCGVLSVFADKTAATAADKNASDLHMVAGLCFDLNAYVDGQVDEPDYDRRLSAFGAIVRCPAASLTLDQWLPLLHNLLFFLRRDEEFGVLASNAADAICKFVRDATNRATHRPRDGDDGAAYEDLLRTTVLPAIYGGARDPSEVVRREVARVFGSLIATLRAWPPVADLAILVPEEDEEATEEKEEHEEQEKATEKAKITLEDTEDSRDNRDSRAFFSSILSPVLAKQMQAMQVLEAASARQALGSRNVSQFFVPLLEQFIFAREDGADDHGLGAQATSTIGQLMLGLEWNQYRAVLRRFLSFVETKPELQKQVVRLLDRVVDALVLVRDVDDDGEEEAAEQDAQKEAQRRTLKNGQKYPLAATLPSTDKFTEEVLALTPGLIAHLHDKDEETVSGRVPVGVVVVKLLSLLPRTARDQRLAGVLTDICHILRSKAWESREMARETLARIAVILGPDSFGFVLKELRGALTRGYQLHVLSYTLHSLLLAVLPGFPPGALDYCLDGAVAVVMDDVFGVAGQEKDAEDYISKMKEVRSSKSQDSMELLARTASVGRLTALVQPLRALLLERVDLAMARKIDTLLGRIAAGLVQNRAAASRDTLVFCYEVVQDVYRAEEEGQQGQDGDGEKKNTDPRTKRFLFQKSTRNNVGGRQASRFTYKLVRFALDVLRTVLRKFGDELRTAENVAGLVPLLGDAVVQEGKKEEEEERGGDARAKARAKAKTATSAEEVQTAAFKLLVVLVRVPFPAGSPAAAAFTGLYRVATREAIRAVSTASSTGSENAQAALKLVAAVLRDRAAADVPVRDAAVDELLARLRDDLTEPLYRHVTFSFLRAVLARRVETAAVYDTLDHVGTVMVTNDDKDTRDLARGAFLQFVREYPQRRSRWQAQLAFVVANLQYEREGGRLSVMEMVHLLLLKVEADDYVQEIVAACFAPLVVVLANDDSARCRAAAAELLRALLRRASRANANHFRGLFRAWLAADAAAKPAVLRLGLQAFGICFSTWAEEGATRREGEEEGKSQERGGALTSTDVEDVQAVISRIADLLAVLGSDSVGSDSSSSSSSSSSALALQADLVATALQTVQALLDRLPARALDRSTKTLWHRIQQYLWYRTGAVRLAAMRLIGQYLADFGRRRAADNKAGKLSETTAIVGSFGLVLADDDITHLVLGCLSILSARSGLGIDEAEAEEAARMLVYLGRHLRAEPPEEEEKGEKVDEEGEGEEEEEDEDEVGESEDDEDDEHNSQPPKKAAVRRLGLDRRYVFLRLARIVRRETPPVAAALVPKAAAMAVLEAFCKGHQGGQGDRDEALALSPAAARAILRPLRNLTDPSVAAPASADPLFAVRHDALRQRAVGLMGVLQARLGNAVYTRLLLSVGAAARDRRQQRASKRKIEAVTMPAKHGRDKRKRMEKKKERRKVRGQEHRSHRRGV